MKFTQGLSLFFVVILTYMTLVVCEYFVINFIIEMFTYAYNIKIIIAIIFMLIINPTITYLIIKRIPYRIYGLKEENIHISQKDA